VSQQSQPVLPATSAFLSGGPQLVIGGEYSQAASGAVLPVYDPATERQIAEAPDGDARDIDRAVEAAKRAFGPWRDLRPAVRERTLLTLAELMETDADELAQLEVLDTGKPFANARREVLAAAGCFRYYAGYATKINGIVNPVSSKSMSVTLKQPIGVCGLITAWNYPLLLAAWKLAPALACGNTVVLKPAEQTPLTSLRLGQLCLEAGLPAGVVNVVAGVGTEAGRALVAHPDVQKISFTGSTAVGKAIAAAAAHSLKRVTLELGGKSANIVFADADLDAAVKGAVRGIFWNSGQVCTAGSRLFVEESIADDVVAKVAERAGELKLGPGMNADTDMGPMVSEEHRKRVRSYIELGKREGAELVTGGDEYATPPTGYFVAPTIFDDVSQDMRIAREEIFGPVLSVLRFKDTGQMLKQVNATPYGLAGGVWTSDITRALKVASAIDSGTVWVNGWGASDSAISFGGVKESGYGRELGPLAIDAYTEPKSITIAM
jgi:acyl-CoA reductase-like NAD-dependent aldehyde dehydrogenase